MHTYTRTGKEEYNDTSKKRKKKKNEKKKPFLHPETQKPLRLVIIFFA
jgi:hypothetical protein